MKNAAAVVVMFLASTLVVCAEGNSAKPRVYVTDSQSWEIAGGFAGSSDGFAGVQRGGSRPQTAEIMKTLGERCEIVFMSLPTPPITAPGRHGRRPSSRQAMS